MLTINTHFLHHLQSNPERRTGKVCDADIAALVLTWNSLILSFKYYVSKSFAYLDTFFKVNVKVCHLLS